MINIPAETAWLIPTLEIGLGVFLIVRRIKKRRKKKK